MTPSEILIAAKGLIDAPEKWIQGDATQYLNGQFQYCSVGAIDHLRTHRDHRLNYIDKFPSIAYLRLGAGISSVASVAAWNDAPERTHADVLAAFDKAIALAQEAGE